MTTVAAQCYTTLDNLNMEGELKQNSVTQYEHVNTSTILYSTDLGDESSITGGMTITLYDAIGESNVVFTYKADGGGNAVTDFEQNSNEDTTATNLSNAINGYNANGSTKYFAVIEYDATFYSTSANESKTITLEINSGGSNDVTFTMVASSATPTAVQFKRETDADTTATNLTDVINNHANFSAFIDKYSTANTGRIIISQIPASKPADNSKTSGWVGITLTNFSNCFNSIVDTTNNKITITQITSKPFNPNGSIDSAWGNSFTSISDFTIFTKAAIPSNTIGTYQIIDNIINNYSSIKKFLLDTQKNLITDLSDDISNSNIDIRHNSFSRSPGTATHQSYINNDKSRGGLVETTNNNTQKPAVFLSDTIKYSEDALFSFLKGISYEIMKFNSGINGNTNGVGAGYSGLIDIPITVELSPASTLYKAVITYDAAFYSTSHEADKDTIILYNYQTAVTFEMVTSNATGTQFLKQSNADTTATNLKNAINGYNSGNTFTAIINTTKKRIEVTQTSSSGDPTNNVNNFVSGITISNFNKPSSMDNVKGTLENFNKIETFDVTANTSEGAIGSNGIISLINKTIEILSLIKKKIKTNETNLIGFLQNISTLSSNMTTSTHDSKNLILKTRGGFADHVSGTDTTYKPSIFNVGSGNDFSEDAVFAFFSSLSYELMKLLNDLKSSNNGANNGYAGFVAIPISVENIS